VSLDFVRRKVTAGTLKPVLTVKWSAAVLDEGYIVYPKRLLRAASRVFAGEHAVEHLTVVLALVDYLRPDMIRPPSVGFLAFSAGMEVERFQMRLDELVEAGLVKVLGNRDALKYTLEGLQQAILENSGED
jgi:hypothetical protein